MENFTPWSSLAGGVLVGLASAALLVLHGRIAGISGIAGGAITAPRGDRSWRVAFLLGLVAVGVVLAVFDPDSFAPLSHGPRSWTSALTSMLAGGLVGVGTQIGNGCTSGHGVCGLSRLSRRSMVAVAVFMATAALTVWLTAGGAA